MTWTEYIFTHFIPTCFQSFRSNFRIWKDLMTENYEGYALMREDDPEAECIDWFWTSLNEDDVYPKEFLEELLQMAADVESGKVKTVPFTQDMFDKLEDLVGDIEVNLNEKLDDDDI